MSWPIENSLASIRLNDAPSYRHVAWVYDALASGYSLGAIDRAKRHHHSMINQGDHVLYAGAGRGGEIVEAFKRGAEVTCVEPCPAMAIMLHDRLASHGERFTIIPRPIQALTPTAEYDLVAAHFFLNVFDAKNMTKVLNQLCGFTKPGGRIVLADFKPSTPSDGQLTRLLRLAYYHPLNLAGYLLRICALHPIYDYVPTLIENGLTIESRQAFRIMPGLPALYEVVTARRA